MASDFQREIDVASKAAVDAAAAILKYYGTADLAVTHKSPQQPLTEADLESNRIIGLAIRSAFPGDAWLSEEDVDNGGRFTKSRVWIVDPLDGTQDFVNRNPEFAVSIGLVEAGVPVVGVICNPVTKELFWAAKGRGAFCGKEKISVSGNRDISRIRLIVSQSEHKRGEWDRFKPHFEIKPTGGTAYKMALIARGDADGCFTLQPKSEWDICAGHVLVTEAGGIVTHAKGERVLYNQKKPLFENLVYCNPHVHAAVLEKIANS